ncbi:hypothetical protein C8Q76DRAFT_726872 [Earliella scabrosa]|nr:hypothetical protein C8Q76DRAFT_726872 [Earliella scabrosa]
MRARVLCQWRMPIERRSIRCCGACVEFMVFMVCSACRPACDTCADYIAGRPGRPFMRSSRPKK